MGREAFLAELRRTLGGSLQESDDGAVLLPRSTRQIVAAVKTAVHTGARIVPPGAPARPDAVAMDLQRMSDVLGIDENSHLVHVQAGMSVGSVETMLRRRELTLGITERPPEQAVGSWLAHGAPGARDHADDPVDQLVAGLEVVLPSGEPLVLRPAPRRAVGPDLIGAIVGARGRLGIIAGAHLVARRRLPGQELGFLFTSRLAAEAAREWIRGRGVRPAAAHVIDAPEGAALRLRLEAHPELLEAARSVAERTATERGGVPVALHDAPAAPAVRAPPQSPIVQRLARRLDPAQVLGSGDDPVGRSA